MSGKKREIVSEFRCSYFEWKDPPFSSSVSVKGVSQVKKRAAVAHQSIQTTRPYKTPFAT